jgi:cytochrome c5
MRTPLNQLRPHAPLPALRIGALACIVALACGTASAQAPATPAPAAKPAQAKKPAGQPSPEEQAFHNNCSRCHAAPEGFSPRIAGTVVKHMRVRANLSAEEERLIMSFFAP